ncbi:hypothetical protein ACCO45_009295 [Purpureocillium lilacinum]|uniref:Uncharacterized protein n=1 Tax=Purpureocillium lilacinum TaxID=33203 RepID=A0ACC4DJG5_PURLI
MCYGCGIRERCPCQHPQCPVTATWPNGGHGLTIKTPASLKRCVSWMQATLGCEDIVGKHGVEWECDPPCAIWRWEYRAMKRLCKQCEMSCASEKTVPGLRRQA